MPEPREKPRNSSYSHSSIYETTSQYRGTRRPAGIPHPHDLLNTRGASFTAAVRSYRASRSAPCRICGRAGQCLEIPDPQGAGSHVYCVRDHTAAGILWEGAGFRERLWYHRLNGPARLVRTPRADIPLVDDATMTRALTYIIRHFGLADEHRAALVRRGYDPESVGPTARHCFASLPADHAERQRVAGHLVFVGIVANDAEVAGVLGIGRDRRRSLDDAPWEFLPNVDGAALIEAVRGPDGRIIGFQYAPDCPTVDDHGKKIKRLGPSRMVISGRPHVAYPAHDAAAELWITEAIHKANLTADARQAVALGAGGVGSMAASVAAAIAIDPGARRLAVIAVDADQRGTPIETGIAHRYHDAGFRVALGRWDASAGNGPDDAIAAGADITIVPWVDDRAPARIDRRISHMHPWQRRPFDPATHAAALDLIGDGIEARVRSHIASGNRADVLIIAAPPGVGKTRACARIGQPDTGGVNPTIAYVVPRHELVEDAIRQPGHALRGYRHIRTADSHTCPEAWRLHAHLAPLGYNTAALHKQHDIPCFYLDQFRASGSAIFQLAHVNTSLLDNDPGNGKSGFDAAIADEYDLPTWWGETDISTHDLDRAITGGDDSLSAQFLHALKALIIGCAQADRTEGHDARRWHGRAVYDALNARLNGNLAAYLGHLMADHRATDDRPWVDLDINDPSAMSQALTFRRVVMPLIIREMLADLPRWQRAELFNSRLRIGPGRHGLYELHITQPTQFSDGIGPLTVLDATADDAIYARAFDRPVIVERAEVTPPPHMQHIHASTRYGKTSLTNDDGRDLARAIAQARYLLAELDTDGTKRAGGLVGLITFSDVEATIGEALGIAEGQRGHFWGIRGSNRLEHCEILIVIGTPTLPPDQMVRLARALYRDDPTPIDDQADKIDKHHVWRDPRVADLETYLIHAELTQCAHRNRPLRHDGRIVVTFCDATIGNLPVTTTIEQFPTLAIDGAAVRTKRAAETEQRIMEAVAALRAEGSAVTSRSITARGHVAMAAAQAWLRAERSDDRYMSDAISDPHIEPRNTIGTFEIASDIVAQPDPIPLSLPPDPMDDSALARIINPPKLMTTPRGNYGQRVAAYMAMDVGYTDACKRVTAENLGRLTRQEGAA